MNHPKQSSTGEPKGSSAQPKPEPTYLYVPFAEKEQARKLGARWDAPARAWFVPPGIPAAPFERWLYLPPIVERPLYEDLHLRDPDPDGLQHLLDRSLPVEAVLMSFECWRCHGDAPAFYGVADRGGFLFIELLYWPETIEEIDAFAKQHNLVSLGTVKPRFSKSLDRSTVSQGCPRCDGIFGNYFVQQEAVHHAIDLPDNYPYRFELEHWPPASLTGYMRERGL